MKTSDNIEMICAALAKAQSEFKVALKDSSNPFFKSNYADFQSVVDAARPALTKHGLGFMQMPSMTDAGVSTLITRVFHASGQYIESTMQIKTTKEDAQAFGAAITYTKRYALQAALGIVSADEDNDAEETMNRDKVDRAASKATITKLVKAFQGLNVSESQLTKYLGITESGKMTEGDVKAFQTIYAEIKADPKKALEYFKESK